METRRRTLKITLSAEWQDQLRSAGKRIAAALATGRYQGEHLNFASPAVLFGKLSDNRWQLVRLLQREGPLGVRQLARLAERDVRRVHDDVKVLLELGMIERQGQGRQMRLVCPYADIHIDMHMRAA